LPTVVGAVEELLYVSPTLKPLGEVVAVAPCVLPSYVALRLPSVTVAVLLFTVKDCTTVDAAAYALFPAWSAFTVQLPVATNASTPLEVTVQTPIVDDENVTLSPELEVAVSAGEVAKV
jgi:hypothetical protein